MVDPTHLLKSRPSSWRYDRLVPIRLFIISLYSSDLAVSSTAEASCSLAGCVPGSAAAEEAAPAPVSG